MAAVCRSVCMVTRLARSDGQTARASVTWWASRRSMASRLRWPPLLVGNSGSSGPAERSLSHAWRRSLIAGSNGVHRRLRPLPTVRTFGAGAEGDVVSGEPGELGAPQPGLDGQGKHGVVAPAGPDCLVARVQQRVDLGVGEVGDQLAFAALGWDGEHPLDGGGVLRVVQGKIGEQGVDGG
jgi:hypothetical protein